MIPADIEDTVQWRIRYDGPSGNEIVRTGTEKQMRYFAELRSEFAPVLESRTITVGEWGPPEEPGDEDD